MNWEQAHLLKNWRYSFIFELELKSYGKFLATLIFFCFLVILMLLLLESFLRFPSCLAEEDGSFPAFSLIDFLCFFSVFARFFRLPPPCFSVAISLPFLYIWVFKWEIPTLTPRLMWQKFKATLRGGSNDSYCSLSRFSYLSKILWSC